MESVLNFLLIRFGVIAGGLVLLALLVFGVAVALKRRGRLDDARRRVAPVVRGAARLASERGRRTGASRGRGQWTSAAIRTAGRYLENDRRDSRNREDVR